MIKIGIVGCAGRMGQMLVRETLAAEGMELAAGSERPGGDAVGRDLGLIAGLPPVGIVATPESRPLFDRSDVVIDFTTPVVIAGHAALAVETSTALVVGTTGLGPEQAGLLKDAAKRVPVVWAPNFSVGVTLLTALVEEVARALDDSYDIEIVEMHHRHKVDAPSGTALGLGRAAAAGRGVDLEQVWKRGRDGITGPRPAGEIGFAALRGGDVAGDHSVIFAADGERLELNHRASSRAIFAKGALRAARWAFGKPAGLYSMTDVLGLGTR